LTLLVLRAIIDVVIKSFADGDTEAVFHGQRVRRLPPQLLRPALRKLLLLDAAVDLKDLWVPPGNRIEKLKGNRDGQYSIRINDQWRICFEWHDGDAHTVEIADYH
jgi:toxin HigB-1